MTTNRPQRPNRPDSSTPELAPKPYQFVSFPKERPNLQRPVGHHKYLSDRLHGTLYLKLKVQTSLHVSTGVVVMGSDIGNNRIPLIKTMIQGVDQKLSIGGSSLKGCIRSVYEAITNSTLAVVTSHYVRNNKYPKEYLPSTQTKHELCPASRIFGASGKNWGWQGLLDFNDAKCEKMGFTAGFMPSLYRPRPEERQAYFVRDFVAGRKFYYHTIRAIDKGQNSGVPVQQAAREYTFTTKLHFKNLLPEELGTLLIILGQDPKYPIALKVGGGKPIGMGTMTVTVDKIEQSQNLKQRYSSYQVSESDEITGENLQTFIQKNIQVAHSRLIQKPQLEELTAILRYPTDREPPAGMY
ncbi:MAG: CRISPR-associated protein [Pelatocladus maniniholoensis HA4357-MV3]|jgi:CRISPR/Cas system CSM-associated protein Csm3 (group 7 of RAMP superfamily)|uniref:CRISPR-associated protein n=1 Tax=Pelatocladus maniniholoensis HA4357-MV3 TaxID=1117104 RepID=A0A9E3LVI1_9NOST|nr:CRISPR-associated protein [Pelatocladus maniniholoensis HA4357-MV3]